MPLLYLLYSFLEEQSKKWLPLVPRDPDSNQPLYIALYKDKTI
jgi:hypothetical protein